MQLTLEQRPVLNFTERYTVYLRDMVMLFAAVIVVFLYASAADGFPLDDSWIHQVYARNLAERGEWAFVPGVPSAASTSPLYTVLLAVGYSVRVPYDVWTHVLGVAALALAGILGGRLTDALLPGTRVPGLFTGLAFVLAWHLVWAAASGMETMLFSMFTLALVYITVQFVGTRHAVSLPINRHGILFGITAALMTMTRPEGILLAVICGGVLVIYHLKSFEESTFVGVQRAAPLLVFAGLSFLVMIIPYLALNLHLTGGLLPATADAKILQHAPLLQRPFTERFWNMTLPVLAGGQIMLLPGVVYFVGMVMRSLLVGTRYAVSLRDETRTFTVLISLLWIISLISLYALRLPAPYQHGRYVIPVLPLWIVLGVVGTYQLVQLGQGSPVGRVLTRSLVMAAALVFLYMTYMGVDIYRRDVQIINEEMVAAALWIQENIPPEELLAVHDIGAVGYFAPRPILDIAGLITPDVVPRMGDASALWQLMQAQNARYLMAFPDQIPGRNRSDPRLCPVFQSPGRASVLAGGGKMVIYVLAWEAVCP